MFLTIYDCESSGLSPYKNEIIQIAAMTFDCDGTLWKPVGEVEIKMQFDMDKANPEALEMNCYDPEVWEQDAVSQKNGLIEFNEYIKFYKDVKRVSKKGKAFTCVRTGGHNVLKFDDEFVRCWYKRHDMFCPFDYGQVFDTLQLAKWRLTFGSEDVEVENHKLETLCDLYGVRLDDAHDALEDVRATARLAWALLYTKPQQGEED